VQGLDFKPQYKGEGKGRKKKQQESVELKLGRRDYRPSLGHKVIDSQGLECGWHSITVSVHHTGGQNKGQVLT
jgi:hypothetical protein